jgi:hypothetical protein
MLKMHVGRFELFDIASDMEVIRKLLAIKFSLAGIYSTDELLKLFFDLIFSAIPAKRGAIFLIGRNPEKFEFMTYRDEPFEIDMELAAQVLRDSDAFMSAACWPLTLGPATFANCDTSLSVHSCSVHRNSSSRKICRRSCNRRSPPMQPIAA